MPCAASASCSRGVTNEPVGLFGFTTTIARVRASHRHVVDLPAAMKLHRERAQLHELQRREMLEQRIRRRGGEHRVAGIGEQLEEKRIRLARRRGEEQIVGIATQLARERLARGAQSARIGIVRSARAARERLRELVVRGRGGRREWDSSP